jgi:hypothetical protein
MLFESGYCLIIRQDTPAPDQVLLCPDMDTLILEMLENEMSFYQMELSGKDLDDKLEIHRKEFQKVIDEWNNDTTSTQLKYGEDEFEDKHMYKKRTNDNRWTVFNGYEIRKL